MPDTESNGSTARTAERVFLQSGFVWQFCWSSFWTLFFLRVVVDVGLDPLKLVLLGTAKEVTILLVEIPTGVVADIRGRRLSVILAFAICGAATIGAGLAPNFALLFLTQMLWAFGSTFRSGAEAAWLTDEVGSLDRVDEVLPRRGRVEAIGSILGLVSMSLFGAATGLSLALAVAGSILSVWAGVLIVRMPETNFLRQPSSAHNQSRALLGDGLRASRRPGLRVLLIAAVMAGFASEAIDRLHVARFGQIGLQTAVIDPAILVGSATVMKSVGAFILLGVLGRRLRGQGLVSALTALHTATAIGVAVLARVDLLSVAVAGFIAQGMMRDIARTVTVGWTNHFTDATNRATVHSFIGQAGSLGEISGGIVLGVIAQQLGIATAMSASAVSYLASAAVANLARTRWSRPAPDTGAPDRASPRHPAPSTDDTAADPVHGDRPT